MWKVECGRLKVTGINPNIVRSSLNSMSEISLGSSERSADFETVADGTCLATGCETHVGVCAMFTHDLHVNVTDIFN